jgi:hypothetical protein
VDTQARTANPKPRANDLSFIFSPLSSVMCVIGISRAVLLSR